MITEPSKTPGSTSEMTYNERKYVKSLYLCPILLSLVRKHSELLFALIWTYFILFENKGIGNKFLKLRYPSPINHYVHIPINHHLYIPCILDTIMDVMFYSTTRLSSNIQISLFSLSCFLSVDELRWYRKSLIFIEWIMLPISFCFIFLLQR